MHEKCICDKVHMPLVRLKSWEIYHFEVLTRDLWRFCTRNIEKHTPVERGCFFSFLITRVGVRSLLFKLSDAPFSLWSDYIISASWWCTIVLRTVKAFLFNNHNRNGRNVYATEDYPCRSSCDKNEISLNYVSADCYTGVTLNVTNATARCSVFVCRFLVKQLTKIGWNV